MSEGAHLDVGLAVHIAQYYLARRRLDEARAALAPFEDAPPQTLAERRALAGALASLASAHTLRRDFDRARDILATARTLAETPAVLCAAAALAAATQQLDVAIAGWRRALSLEPSNDAAWRDLARAFETMGDASAAAAAYLASARHGTSHANMLAIAERVAALAPARPDTPAAERVRIALLGSSTLDHLRAYLEVACRLDGLVPDIYLGPFGQYAQEILNPQSELYAFEPDVVVLAVHGRALFPELYDAPFDLSVAERKSAAAAAADGVADLLSQLSSHTSALVLLHTFGVPQYSPLSTLDLHDEFGQTAIFQTINHALAERIRRDFPFVRLVDEDRVFGRIGKRHVTDTRMWYLARIGFTETALEALSAEYLRFIKALKGRTRKCLVLDLDNTLWGGVVAENGPHGIAVGHEAPGNAFRAFQEAILSLSKRGVILAINSKNNESDAMQVLQEHPDMVLRPHHFASIRINWNDKVTNLRSIADELNIGLDSLVFIDDNPAECALVRDRLPEVLTVELPPDPALYRSTLLSLTDFETLTLSDEDRQRGQLYAQRRERQAWEASQAHASEGLGDYLSQLDLIVDIAEADEFALPRVAQLLNKTNQFNVTTRRHTEAAVRAFAAAADATVYAARVRDRFGDHGLVGAAILTHAGPGDLVWEIDSLLLSCRIMGRGVETAMLSVLAADAKAAGALRLRGIIIPTAKNAPARTLYSAHGFTHSGEDAEGQVWELDLHASAIQAPPWLTLSVRDAVVARR